MKRIAFFILIGVAAIAGGCKPSREKSLKQITDLETRISSAQAMQFDKIKADSLMALYNNFIVRFPKDSLAPKFLFRSAQMAMTLNDGPKALELFDRFMTGYPENPRTPSCMFFKAYVYENLLHNLDKAKEIYLDFAEKYPTNEFARDARIAVQNLGKSPEQMVREFEARMKADSARRADSVLAIKKKPKKR